MRKKLFLSGSLLLLLAVLLFMVWDIFFNRNEGNINPHAYNLDEIRSGDTSRPVYAEWKNFPAGMDIPRCLAADPQGFLYLGGNRTVAVFDSAGRKLREFRVGGEVTAITTGDDGTIYLALTDHPAVFDRNGRLLAEWQPAGDCALITSLAITGEELFAADAANRVVVRYSPQGRPDLRIGQKDPERNIPGFVIPSAYFDLAAGAPGEIWVVNPGRHLFHRFTREGELKTSWGVSSMRMEGFCGCCNPSNFAILSDGSFVTAEKGIERVKLYWPDGTFRGLVAGPDSFIEGTRGLDPAILPGDRIALLDPEKKLIRIFQPIATEKP